MKNTRFRNLRVLRRISQLGCLTGFLWLFMQTEYRGLDELPYPVSLLFRIDPMAALADALAPGPFGWKLLWPALLLLALTVLFGRFFCGWVCPLGSTLDGCSSLVGRRRTKPGIGWWRVKYYLLFALSAAALFGVQLFGLFDPLSIFLRSLTLSLYPVYNLFLNGLFDFTYSHHLPLFSPLANSSYPFFRGHLMAFHQPVYTLGLFTLVVFLLLLMLEKVQRRFWCRNLCPLGALLGLCSRHSLVKRRPQTLCGGCRTCSLECRMNATGEQGHSKQECILCLDCTGYCPEERVEFSLAGFSRGKGEIDLSRRGVTAALAGGLVLAPTVRIAPDASRRNGYLLRPPGAVAEKEFLQRCIRCGECMKVCIGQALHPAFLQAGASALWTPLLLARIGYCEYNCTLCGQVCPTGAIRQLSLAEKQKTVIGIAVIDKNRCLPFARGEECLVCEEHCPTGEKAIVFEEKVAETGPNRGRPVKYPRIVKKRCVGCGVCETKCPVEGRSAVLITNEGESRRPSGSWV